MTASKMGRSWAGPEAKYSSMVIAGAHSWPWLARRNNRAHDGHVHAVTAHDRWVPG